ncbi:MAG TPA: AcvB/VirJ family lysyl-phosphatidylglycerol hydrolase [Steroidobacteraceae bacterium]|nr:AcvB/VirJ family lysyl-phosphatidylglycerol hydrolase [Steroidobacteraceae bacterium]
MAAFATAASSATMTVAAKGAATGAAPAPAEVFNYGRFGTVSIYRGRGNPHDAVLFVSGDGGWNLGVISMAQRLANKGAVVAGIDIRHYLAQLEKASGKCVSPAVDFENLSHYLQAKLGLKNYLQPTLVGYSSGATLVYATLAESPDGLFKGALSIGFCPDLDLKKPVCKGSGIDASPRLDSNGALKGVNFLPAKQLPGKWISLQGESDQVCPAPLTQKFIAAVPGGEIVMLPKVGHGYSVEKNWVPQYEAAYDRLAAPQPAAKASGLAAPVADLPLTVVPAADGGGNWFGIFLTGDGGWVGLDKEVSAELAKHDIPIIGWDSLKYFWSPRTPEGAAQDLDRVLRHYSQALGRSHALLIGYSQGADTMPFMVNRLPAATRKMVGLTTLLGISDNAVFEFHVANWLGNPSGGLPTAPELERWTGSPYLCLYGEDDADSACKQLTGHDGSALEMPGGHHFGGGYAEIAEEILSRLPTL